MIAGYGQLVAYLSIPDGPRLLAFRIYVPKRTQIHFNDLVDLVQNVLWPQPIKSVPFTFEDLPCIHHFFFGCAPVIFILLLPSFITHSSILVIHRLFNRILSSCIVVCALLCCGVFLEYWLTSLPSVVLGLWLCCVLVRPPRHRNPLIIAVSLLCCAWTSFHVLRLRKAHTFSRKHKKKMHEGAVPSRNASENGILCLILISISRWKAAVAA